MSRLPYSPSGPDVSFRDYSLYIHFAMSNVLSMKRGCGIASLSRNGIKNTKSSRQLVPCESLRRSLLLSLPSFGHVAPQGFRRQRWVCELVPFFASVFRLCEFNFPVRQLYREHCPLVCSILVISLSQSTLEPHLCSIKLAANVLAEW